MDTRHLIDGIVRQTTALIAQLSTAAGIRAPLARVADQVFLDLTREIEAQGVRRKVVADMFGMALRTYQKKVNRLTQSADGSERTLWEATLDYLRSRNTASRKQILEHFKRHEPQDVAAVLRDLSSTGLVQIQGRGEEALYAATSDSDFRAMRTQEQLEAITHLVWLLVSDRRCISRTELMELADQPSFSLDRELTQRALDALIGDGRITSSDQSGTQMLSCARLTIPVGAEQGWEAAVLDHFSTVTAAIATKLRANATRSLPDDVVGGSTLSFGVYPGHPFEKQVYGLLKRVRHDVHQLWDTVSAYNQEHPADPAGITDVSFYFGQSIREPDDGAVDEMNSKGDRP